MTINAFLDHLVHQKRFSSHTVTAYRTDLLQFQSFLKGLYGRLGWDQVATYHVRSWMVQLLEEEQSPASIRRKLSSLKSFYRHWRKQDPNIADPTKGIHTPKLPKRMVEVVDSASMARLLATFGPVDDFSAARDRVLLELLYATGLRRSEVMRLKDADVLLRENRLRIRGKGGKERIVPFGPASAKVIRDYLDFRQAAFPGSTGSSFLLTDKGKPPYPKWVYNRVKRYLGSIPHLEQRSPHVLRHSFATHLSDEGADLNAIKALLGHSSLAATQVYTHNSVEKLKRSYEAAHPKARSSNNANKSTNHKQKDP